MYTETSHRKMLDFAFYLHYVQSHNAGLFSASNSLVAYIVCASSSIHILC